jgi:hypothetical protein
LLDYSKSLKGKETMSLSEWSIGRIKKKEHEKQALNLEPLAKEICDLRRELTQQ